MPAASTAKLSVQVLDFERKRLLIQLDCLVCDFCSSSQRFACGFLQIPPRDGHPCRPANDSPCRARRRLSLPSKSALPGARRQELLMQLSEPRFLRMIIIKKWRGPSEFQCRKMNDVAMFTVNHRRDLLSMVVVI